MRHRSCRRLGLLSVFVGVLVLALSLPAVAFAAGLPSFPWMTKPLSVKPAVAGPVAIPIQGDNRYLTAVEASKQFASASTVVVASGENFPDALGGAALAGAVDGPLLLTPKASVPAEVLAEIARLGATKVYVLGSSNAVSDDAFAQLDAAVATVVRLGGVSRYATAQLVADETISLLGDSYTGDVFLATGQNFPDALAAAPIMYSQGIPLVLVAKGGAYVLPDDAMNATILGSTDSVPASVEDSLGDKFVDRIYGPTRYATAAALAEYGAELGMGWNELGVATGQKFPDALCAGPLAGSKNAVLLLTPSNSLAGEAEAMLGAHKDEISEYYLFGSTSALSDDCRGEIADVLASDGGEDPWDGHYVPQDVSCAATGCHDTDLATIHIKVGCYMCHSRGATPSGDCVSCHGETVHDAEEIHKDIASVPVGSDPSCTQSGCHVADSALAFHENCAQCHASSRKEVKDAIKAGGATCETCHVYATVHDGGDEAHTVSGDCFTSTCHGTDVAKMHSNDFRGTGDAPPMCVPCHRNGSAPSTDCLSCHVNMANFHDPAAAHRSVEASISGTNSKSCTACHGTNIMNVAANEHVGCSCHAYYEVRGAKECVDCHDDQYAPHGFVDGFAHGGGWIPTSGHSTTTFGKRGVYEDFSSFPVTDTAGHSIDTTTWPFPTANVFWDGVDPSPVAGAKTGLTKNSTVTCEDCHTGLVPYEVNGPHGGNVIANAGIDPAFPGKFEEAYLWGGPLPSGGATLTSGIARYIPGGSTEEEKQELANWALRSYITSQTYVPGPATVVSGNDVICAKCHDLYNDGTGMIGWSNYGHEHHATRPVLNMGLFQRASDGSTYTAEAKEDAADTQLKAASLAREGAGACRDCHIAIPHGWKRPRLIVYSTDPAPYNIGPSTYEGEPVTGTNLGSGQMNGMSSVIGPKPYATGSWLTGLPTANQWSSSQCNACGHHSGTNLSAGAWK